MECCQTGIDFGKPRHCALFVGSVVSRQVLGKVSEAEENFDPAAVELVAPREINSNDGDVLLPYDEESMSVSCEDAINKGVRFKDLGREDASPGHVTVTVGNDNENGNPSMVDQNKKCGQVQRLGV